MKKFLLCMLLAGLMMPVVAQEKMKVREKMMNMLYATDAFDSGLPLQGVLPENSRGTLVDVDGWKRAGLSQLYDCQTQGGVYQMSKIHDDNAFIGCIWTNSDAPPYPGNTDLTNRNVGYAYSTDRGLTWSEQENRLGGIPVYWGSYAQWGKNGEAVMARSYFDHEIDGIQIKDGLVLFTRETRGEGEWTITPVPYPADANPLHFMAWGSMTTSGEEHQYIHIVTPMSNQDIPNVLYHEYATPTLYFRTQDGKTWDIDGQVVPEMVGDGWNEGSYYADGMSWAVEGNTVVCSFINMGSHGYVMRSHDNGETWAGIKFFDSPILRDLTAADYPDSVYIPSIGTVALDNNGKIHIAFSAVRCANGGGEGIGYWPYAFAQFLSYWNEDMPPINGDADFNTSNILPLLMGYDDDGEYFDWGQSEGDQLYVKSTVPKWPVMGYFIPTEGHLYTFLPDAEEWAGGSYAQAGMFTFPQIVFDANNALHLTYLGLLSGGTDGDRWLRHPFYTTSPDGGTTWTETEYLVNWVGVVDQEFAYLTLAGIGNDGNMILMAQTDVHAGNYVAPGVGAPSDHGPTDNSFTFFWFPVVSTGIPSIEYTSLSMQLFPNPASGQVKVTFEGKGDITVYNMLGQTVYHVENVENHKDIPLNMASGVYFVTVRAGNAMATQKLVVK